MQTIYLQVLLTILHKYVNRNMYMAREFSASGLLAAGAWCLACWPGAGRMGTGGGGWAI